MIKLSNQDYLYIILLLALIPIAVVILKLLQTKNAITLTNPPKTYLKYRVKRKPRYSLLLFIVGILLLGGFLIQDLSLFNVLFFLFLMREISLEHQLYIFEKENELVYDTLGGMHEYKGLYGKVFFSSDSVKSIVVHRFLGRFKNAIVADIYLEDRAIRLTSGLVNFDEIPILKQVENCSKKTYYIGLQVPAQKSL